MLKFLVRISLCWLAWGVPPALASRRIIAPPNTFRIPVNTVTAPPRAIGFELHVQVSLANLSDVPQTGIIRLLPGTLGYGRCIDAAGTLHHFAGNFTVTGSTTCTASPTYNQGIGILVTNAPYEASFTLAGKGSAALDVGIWVKGRTPFTAGLDGCDGLDSQFSPLIELIVNEDRGAIVGSLTPMFDIMVCPTVNFCGMNVAAICGSPVSPINFVSVPLLINGGRAF